MNEKIKNAIKRNEKLYALARCLQNINNPVYHKMISGYFDLQGDTLALLIDNPNRLSDNPVFYDISFGVTSSECKGFCAMLYWTIWYIWFAEKMHFVPSVLWGQGCSYYDSGMDGIAKNAFEYYFDPITNVDWKMMHQNFAVCLCDPRHISHFGFSVDSYSDFDDKTIPILSAIYKKSIHLNSQTQQYISAELSALFQQGKILGVHIRGTDFKKGFKNHPIAVTFATYLEKTKELFSTGKYERIFLATDDLEAFELYTMEFNDKLVTYSDVFRTEGNDGLHLTENDRPLHHYKLGLEVLRDVYTLANCDGLVCGLSNVSFAARYISRSLNRKYDDIVVLDNGIAREDSKEAKKDKKQLKKQ